MRIHAFTDFICAWLESVNDWYILHAKSFEMPFQKFTGVALLQVVSESDKGGSDFNVAHETQNPTKHYIFQEMTV